jgi:hypothetical protein
MTDYDDKSEIARRRVSDRDHLDQFDRELDAALVKFAAVEPRTGLEERILANLRAEQERAAAKAWWRWPAVAALAAVILVTMSVAWWSGKVRNITTQHPPTTQTNERHGTPVANKNGSSPMRLHHAGSERRVKPHAFGHPAAVVVAAPKLDQFPSPQPLSEQEKILARYVTKYPEHAALIAQARTEELRLDSAEEMGDANEANENSQPRDK